MTSPNDLLPELKEWNNGKGISPLSYFFCLARSDITIASIELFWPTFVIFEEYVFRAGFEEAHVRQWQKQRSITRKNVEAAVNYLDINDLFRSAREERPDLLEERCRLIRSTVVEIYQAKLSRDFPDRLFEVNTDSDDEDISFTFFQI